MELIRISGAENALSAIAELRKLVAEKAAAEQHVAELKDSIAFSKSILKSLIAQPKTPENTEYLSIGKKALRTTIAANEFSIWVYLDDIKAHEKRIAAIKRSNPEARLDH